MDDATARHYRTRSSQMADIYHAVDSIHLPHLATLLRSGDRVLDIGCGTGRDVQWLRERGFDAMGVDATEEMLDQGRQRYNLAGEHISRDVLPALATVHGQFEAVTCISVLHHIGPTELLDALYRLRSLLAPGGFLVIKTPVRHPAVRGDRHADGRYYTLRNPSEYRFFLQRLGLRRTASFDEHYETTDSNSCTQVFVGPLGTELNPMETVESVLWDDRKVNTYKFALIRAVADLASRRTRVGRWIDDGRVTIPTSEIAERWLEYYWPLVEPPAVSTATATTEPVILLGQKITGKQDMVFRAAMERGILACVWTEQPIKTGKNLAVDHAIPWSLWFTNALWNFLPVQTTVNAGKSDRLPTRTLLERRRDRIEASWEILWRSETTMFRAHAGRLIGQQLDDFGRHDRSILFDAFKNSIEFTAANRSVKRWKPE